MNRSSCVSWILIVNLGSIGGSHRATVNIQSIYMYSVDQTMFWQQNDTCMNKQCKLLTYIMYQFANLAPPYTQLYVHVTCTWTWTWTAIHTCTLYTCRVHSKKTHHGMWGHSEDTWQCWHAPLCVLEVAVHWRSTCGRSYTCGLDQWMVPPDGWGDLWVLCC